MDRSSVVKSLRSALKKADKADYTTKYDVLYLTVQRIADHLEPKPIEDWKNGHYGEKEKA